MDKKILSLSMYRHHMKSNIRRAYSDFFVKRITYRYNNNERKMVDKK
jgi:hypothetical protein